MPRLSGPAPITVGWRAWAPWLWHDGGLRPAKLACLVLVMLPLAWLAGAIIGGLGPRPLEWLVKETGRWTIRVLLLALAVTPLRQITGWQALGEARRTVGLAAFAYAMLHLALWMADQGFLAGRILAEMIGRPALAVGALCLCGLAVLAATSTDGMLRRLGGRRWRALHRLVYLLAAAGLLHNWLQAARAPYEAVLLSGLYLWLMGFRLLPAPARRQTGALLLLGLLSAALLALAEGVHLHSLAGAPLLLVLQANLAVETGLRPAVWLLAFALVAAALPRLGQRR